MFYAADDVKQLIPLATNTRDNILLNPPNINEHALVDKEKCNIASLATNTANNRYHRLHRVFSTNNLFIHYNCITNLQNKPKTKHSPHHSVA